jgi:hypothetical protein
MTPKDHQQAQDKAVLAHARSVICCSLPWKRWKKWNGGGQNRQGESRREPQRLFSWVRWFAARLLEK